MKTHEPGLLSLATPAKLSAYLSGRSWHVEERVDGRWAAWSKQPNRPDGADTIEVVVPLDVSFRDYTLRITEALDNLAIAEQRAPDQILRDILSSDHDRVRLRIAGPTIKAGRVSLAVGSIFTSVAQNLMATAARASDASSVRGVYSGRSSRRVTQFLDKVELLPPEPGSFILNLEIPVAPQLQLALDGEDMSADELPFERQVGVSLATSLAAAEESLRAFQHNGDQQAFSRGIANGVSANLCEALARILEETPTEIFEAEFSWSSNRPIPCNVPSKTTFAREAAPVFREAARQIRYHTPVQDFQVAGFPITLTARDDKSASEGGTVAVMATIDDKPKRVQIELAPADYAIAIEAHGGGRAIQLEGELARRGRTYVLTNVRHVEVLNDDA